MWADPVHNAAKSQRDRVWRAGPLELPRKNKEQEAKPSVHLETFPEVVPIKDQEALEAQWKELLAIRTLVLGALEQQRREKVIGSSLEARVVLHAGLAFLFLVLPRKYIPDIFSGKTQNRCHELSYTCHDCVQHHLRTATQRRIFGKGVHPVF